MAGRPEKGKRYPKSKLNQMFGGALLGQALGASPDDMSITSTGDAQGPMPDGDTMSGPSLSAMEPMAPRRMEAVDTRSGLEKWFKPNSAGEFNNRMAYEEGANNLRLAANLAELKAKFNYENLSIDKKAKIDQMLEEMRNNNAITQQGLKAADEAENARKAQINAVAQQRNLFNTGRLPLDELNHPVERAQLAKDWTAAGFYEGVTGAEAYRNQLKAQAEAPGVENTNKLGMLDVAKQNADLAAKRLPIEQQNADTDRLRTRYRDLSSGGSLLDLGDGASAPTVKFNSPEQQWDNVVNPTTLQNERVLRSSRGVAQPVIALDPAKMAAILSGGQAAPQPTPTNTPQAQQPAGPVQGPPSLEELLPAARSYLDPKTGANPVDNSLVSGIAQTLGVKPKQIGSSIFNRSPEAQVKGNLEGFITQLMQLPPEQRNSVLMKALQARPY